jgi:hypothetical protein
MGYKVFTAGEEALASDVNTLLMSQTVARFASAAARSTQLTAPVLNQLSVLDSAPGRIDYWNGSAWASGTSGAELGYAQFTTPITVTSTSSAAAHVFANPGAITYDGTPVVMEAFSPYVTCPAGGAKLYIGLYDGAALLSVMGGVSISSGQVAGSLHMIQRLTPSAGSHTYSTATWVDSGSGLIEGRAGTAGTFAPGFMRITRV